MVDQDILIEKINSIQNCLSRIHGKIAGDLDKLIDLDVQDIVVLNLQRAVQLTIDIAMHITSSENLGLPDNLKDTFRLLHTHKIIDKDLSEKMQKMVGFRNIAVHEYEIIDELILHKVVENHLVDIEDFYSTILKTYQNKA